MIGAGARVAIFSWQASLDEDGYFWARASAGVYRIEYLRVGKRAEFFAPQEVVIRPGALTCAGMLGLELEQIESLGANVNNRITVTDPCPEITPRPRRAAGTATERVTLAQPGPLYEHVTGVTWRDLLVGLRAEVAFGDFRTVRGLAGVPQHPARRRPVRAGHRYRVLPARRSGGAGSLRVDDE